MTGWRVREDVRRFLEDYGNWSALTSVCVTVDVDFAPDYMIDECVGLLDSHGVAATFYATHPSPVVSRIDDGGRYEVGLHPNLTPGSTQGASLREIVGMLRQHHPNARGNRFHLLGSSYRDLALLSGLGIEYDVSTLRFNGAYLLPVWHADIDLTKLTYFWEDGVCETAGLAPRLDGVDLYAPGMKIFNFHPLNLYLNAGDDRVRRRFLQENPDLGNCPEEVARRYRQSGEGARTFLDSLLTHLDVVGCRTVTAIEIARAYPKVTRQGEVGGEPGV